MSVGVCVFANHDFNIETMETFLCDFSNRLQLGKSQNEIKEFVKNAKNVSIQDDDSIFAEIDLGDYSFRYETDSSFNTILYNEINVYHKVVIYFFGSVLIKKYCPSMKYLHQMTNLQFSDGIIYFTI